MIKAAHGCHSVALPCNHVQSFYSPCWWASVRGGAMCELRHCVARRSLPFRRRLPTLRTIFTAPMSQVTSSPASCGYRRASYDGAYNIVFTTFSFRKSSCSALHIFIYVLLSHAPNLLSYGLKSGCLRRMCKGAQTFGGITASFLRNGMNFGDTIINIIFCQANFGAEPRIGLFKSFNYRQLCTSALEADHGIQSSYAFERG